MPPNTVPKNRKWTYWHEVIEVKVKTKNNFKVGQKFGLSTRHQKEFHGFEKGKGFFVEAVLKYLGRLPYELEITDPKEAGRRIDAGEWSR